MIDSLETTLIKHILNQPHDAPVDDIKRLYQTLLLLTLTPTRSYGQLQDRVLSLYQRRLPDTHEPDATH